MKQLVSALSTLTLCCAVAYGEPGSESVAAPNGVHTAEQPTEIGVFYHVEPGDRRIVRLERQTAIIRSKLRTLGFRGRAFKAEISGRSSPVRLGPSAEFVVRLSAGVDPTKYRLYRYRVRRHKRELVMAAGGKSAPPEVIFQVRELGNSIFAFSIPGGLGPGEYCFSPYDSNDTFNFGVGSSR